MYIGSDTLDILTRNRAHTRAFAAQSSRAGPVNEESGYERS